MIKKSIVWLILIIGIAVFFYPIVANWLSTKEHHSVISSHNEALELMSHAEKLKERKKAEAYNTALDEQSIPVMDPFSPDVNTDETTGYYSVLDIGEAMGKIEIPDLDLNLPIYHGVSEEVLQRGIGHMSNSSFPVGGLNTHTALTGHRGLPSSKLFRNLDKLKIGDTFLIHMLDDVLAYEVEDIMIVLPTETSWLEMRDDKDYVTLITCEPYMINTHRLLVRGERVPYIAADETVEVSADLVREADAALPWRKIIVIGIGSLLLLLLFCFVIWKKGRRTL